MYLYVCGDGKVSMDIKGFNNIHSVKRNSVPMPDLTIYYRMSNAILNIVFFDPHIDSLRLTDLKMVPQRCSVT